MPLDSLLPTMALQFRRDLTVSVVGFTSWAAVAWKVSRGEGVQNAGPGAAPEALLALGAALLCLWPLPLGQASEATYARWREWLVPAHLAAQHWIGLHFSLPSELQQALQAPGWARGMLPIFLATFCRPWLYLAFGSCLQRTRLRTFLWTQPLLLAPILWMGRSHCAAQLAATPAAADQLQRIAAAMQRCSAWLPVGLLAGGTRGGGAALQAPLDVASSCLSVHFWLVLMLALCLPAILIHRLEGQERQALWEVRKRQRTMSDSQHGGSGGTAAGAQEPQRDLLLQQPQSVLGSIGELALAGYAAWLAGQLALQVLQGSSGS